MELKKSVKLKTVRIFLFYGADDHSVQKKVEAWVAAFAAKHSRQGITRLDAGEEKEKIIEKLRDAVSSPSLFSSTRLVVVKSLFGQPAEMMEGAAELLDALAEEVYLVFWEAGAVKKNLKLYKKLSALATKGLAKIQNFEIPDGHDLNRFIQDYARQKKATISPAAAELLAVRLGRDLAERVKTAAGYDSRQVYNLWQVTSELDKLISYAAGRQVSPADVEKLVAAKVSDNVFLLTTALGKKDLKNSLRCLNELLDANQSKAADARGRALMIVGALAGQFRSLLQLASAKDEGGAGQLADALGWSPWRVRANLPLLQNYSKPKLREILKHLLQIDKRMKSTGLPPKVLLSRFISRV